jgi:hypothetical protein
LNDGFGALLIDRVNWVVGAVLTIAQKMVLLVLAQHDGPRGIFPSRATIAREAGLSIAAVKRTLKELVTMSLVERTFRYEEDSRENTTSLYRLTLPIPSVGSARAPVGSQGTHLGSDRAQGWVQGEPGVGSHRAPEQPDLTANKERPTSAPRGAGLFRSHPSVKKSRAKKPAPDGYLDVVERYFQLFEEARQERPAFNGRAVAAMNRFVRECGRDKAIEKLERVYATSNWWRGRANIVDIASNPDKYTTPPTTNGVHRGTDVQRDGYDAAKSEANATFIREQRRKGSAS